MRDRGYAGIGLVIAFEIKADVILENCSPVGRDSRRDLRFRAKTCMNFRLRDRIDDADRQFWGEKARARNRVRW